MKTNKITELDGSLPKQDYTDMIEFLELALGDDYTEKDIIMLCEQEGVDIQYDFW